MNKKQKAATVAALLAFFISGWNAPWERLRHDNYGRGDEISSRDTFYAPLWQPPSTAGSNEEFRLYWGSLLGTWFVISVLSGGFFFLFGSSRAGANSRRPNSTDEQPTVVTGSSSPSNATQSGGMLSSRRSGTKARLKEGLKLAAIVLGTAVLIVLVAWLVRTSPGDAPSTHPPDTLASASSEDTARESNGLNAIPKKADAAGTWTWTIQGRQGGPDRKITVKIKVDGDKVTGTVSSPGRDGQTDDTEIQDGKIKNDEISFSTTREINGNKRAVKYSGKVSGDTIKGKVEFDRNGEPVKRDWEAKRAGDSK